MQSFGRSTRFICGVSTIQSDSDVHTFSVGLLSLVLWHDMGSCGWDIFPGAILLTHKYKRTLAPQAIWSATPSSARCCWLWRNSSCTYTTLKFCLPSKALLFFFIFVFSGRDFMSTSVWYLLNYYCEQKLGSSRHLSEGEEEDVFHDAEILDEMTTSRGEIRIRTISFKEVVMKSFHVYSS